MWFLGAGEIGASKTVVSLLVAAITVALAFFVQSESESEKFRSEAFTVMLVVALLIAIWAVLGSLFAERRRTDPRAHV